MQEFGEIKIRGYGKEKLPLRRLETKGRRDGDIRYHGQFCYRCSDKKKNRIGTSQRTG